jgi:quinol-cytochrome oxidoreductase complex cytochrome b subunit
LKPLKTIILVLLVLIANPAFADGQGKIFWPWWVVVGFYILCVVVASLPAIVISIFYKLVYERTRKEKRRTVIWMAICTLALPTLFICIDSVDSLIYTSKYSYKGTIGEIIYKIIIGLLIIVGFNVGYFITPKIETGQLSKRTRRENRKAILLQLIFCVILPSLIIYLSISPELKRLKRLVKKNVRVSAQIGVLPNKKLEKNICQPKCYCSRPKS